MLSWQMHSFLFRAVSLIGVARATVSLTYVHTYHITKPLIVTDKAS